MQPAGVEAVGLDGAVGVRGQVAIFQVAEGDGLARGGGERRPGIRRLAIVLDEGHDVGAVRQHQQPLLQPHEQIIDLPGLVLGFGLFDRADGEGVPPAVVHELAVVRIAFFLEGSHWRLLTQCQCNAILTGAEELQKSSFLHIRARGPDSP